MKRLRNFRKKLFKLRFKNFVRAFWIFIFTSVVFGSIFTVGAQGGFYANSEAIENDPFLENNSTQLLVGLNSAEVNQAAYGCDVVTWSGFFGDSVRGLSRIVIGPSTEAQICTLQEFRETNDPQGIYQLLQGGNLGLNAFASQLNAAVIEQRPASGVGYVQDKVYAFQDFGKVRAQESDDIGYYYRGTGFDLLKPVQAFWGWSVNIVYGLLIFIIIIVSFAIIFRAQLPGGVVVTIQNSIPNIALAMILVPLSYAITGLFIDGITVGVNVSHEFLLGPGSPAREVYNRAVEQDLNGLFTPGFDPENRGLHADDVRVSWLYSGSQVNVTDELGSGVNAVLSIFNITEGLAGLPGDLVGLVAPIINLIIGFLLLFTGFRIFWLLFKKFIMLLLMPLASPFVFATVALPGNGVKSVINFAKQMGSITVAYIVAYTMILLSIIFSSAYFQNQIADVGNTTFIPPVLGLEIVGFEADINQGGLVGLLLALVSVGIYLMIPKVLNDIDEAMGATGTIPFITDVLQSARDSVNTGRALAGAPLTATAEIQKRLFGVGDDDFYSARNFVGRRTAGLSSRLRTAAENVNVPIIGDAARIAAGAAGSALSTGANLATGTNISGGGTDDDGNPLKGQLKVEFKWNAGGGQLKLDDLLVNQISSARLANGFFTLQGPKLAIQAENGKLPARLMNTTVTIRLAEGVGRGRLPGIRGANFSDSTVYRSGASGEPDNLLVRAGSRIFTFMNATDFFDRDNQPDIAVLGDSFPSESNRTVGAIKLMLRIPQNDAAGNDGRESFIKLLASNFVKSNEGIYLNINGMISNPVEFMVISEVNNAVNTIPKATV